MHHTERGGGVGAGAASKSFSISGAEKNYRAWKAVHKCNFQGVALEVFPVIEDCVEHGVALTHLTIICLHPSIPGTMMTQKILSFFLYLQPPITSLHFYNKILDIH
jgi:hypothetical protein